MSVKLETLALTTLPRNLNVGIELTAFVANKHLLPRQSLIAVTAFFDQLVRKELTIVGFNVAAYGARLKSACGQLGKWIAEVRRPGFSPPSAIVVRQVDSPLPSGQTSRTRDHSQRIRRASLGADRPTRREEHWQGCRSEGRGLGPQERESSRAVIERWFWQVLCTCVRVKNREGRTSFRTRADKSC